MQQPKQPEPGTTYTVPGLKPGDPEIVIVFRRPPADVARDLARFLQQQPATH